MAKTNKSIYREVREQLGLSREQASDALVSITPERLERIENGKINVLPEDVVAMAEAYKAPQLRNHYCANECPIGQQDVPEIKLRELAPIVLEMLASLNTMSRKKDRLIEIAADGTIDGDELADFVFIQEELEKISMAVDALQLWSERMLASGAIDRAAYERLRK